MIYLKILATNITMPTFCTETGRQLISGSYWCLKHPFGKKTQIYTQSMPTPEFMIKTNEACGMSMDWVQKHKLFGHHKLTKKLLTASTHKLSTDMSTTQKMLSRSFDLSGHFSSVKPSLFMIYKSQKPCKCVASLMSSFSTSF